MIYGYARVSTKGQAKDGNSLEAQEKLLRENGATMIYSDSFTGTKTNRPNFNKLMEALKEGDTLIVTKLDRFARSFTQGSELVTKLIDKGIKINILNIGIMDNTPSSKLIRNIFFSFAEFERDMIIERTQEGKTIAKEKAKEEGGVFKEGRPRAFDPARIEEALKMLTVNGGNKSYKQVAHLTGISLPTLVRRQQEYRNKQQ
jgi:DNA invertase Pin-like site-specific DNA recombinase